MVIVKNQLNKKEKEKVSSLLNDLLDVYRDFYLTKSRTRLFIKENKEILFEDLKKGDIIGYSDKGIAVITGIADKVNRLYLKCLTETNEEANRLLQAIIWKVDRKSLYAKLKKANPLIEVFKEHGFEFKGDRGVELLLERKP